MSAKKADVHVEGDLYLNRDWLGAHGAVSAPIEKRNMVAFHLCAEQEW